LFAWAIRKDYLTPTNRLLEADSMRPQVNDSADAEIYTHNELKALLDAAKGPMRAMVAIGGLAGLRTQELLRLTWDEVWKREGHIEVNAVKAKTRQRRVVEIVPALAQWLAPYRESTGKVWPHHEITFQQNFVDLCASAKYKVKEKEHVVTRKHNGLRHSFCSYHYALHNDETSTAYQAGNSPAMIHAHYKELATKKESEAYFAVSPATPENVISITTIADAG
jgi:integrase